MNRSFWLLWSASTLSALGDGIRYVAFPLIATTFSSDPRAVSLVFVAGYLPWPLFGLLGGAVSDWYDRRSLMLLVDLGRAVVMGAFAIAVAGVGGAIAVLMTVSFLIGTAETVFDSSASAIVPQLVAPKDLERANSWLFSAQAAASTLVGAVVGAVLFAVWRAGPLVTAAACFLVAAVLVAALAPVGRPADSAGAADAADTVGAVRPGLAGDVLTGLRWLGRHRLLRTVCALVTVLNGVTAVAEAVLVLYAGKVLNLGDLGYGVLLSVLALSTVAGSGVAPKVRKLTGYPGALVGGAVLMGGAVLLAGLTSNLPAAITALTLAGLANGMWNVVAVSLRQRIVPEHLLGRVTSIYRTIALTAMPVGAGLSGVVAEHYGLHAPFVVGGLLLVAAGLASAPEIVSASRQLVFEGGDQAARTS
ncbi:MFS transporter [Streptomyces sp. NPDC023838]|uniref:MFS transporter n=1 Tax=Streptomyces sp. NPDC023838 TaxID=3154325 RepID=UPI0033FEB07C